MSLSGSTLSCTPNGKAGEQSVEVYVPTKGYATGFFTYLVPHSISALSITTSSFAGGRELVISGSGFDESAIATIGGVVCPISSQTSAEIVCEVPAFLT